LPKIGTLHCFLRKTLFCKKLAKIAENFDNNIEPWGQSAHYFFDRYFVVIKNIFLPKILEDKLTDMSS
jgi:hypothetical protein